MQQSGLAGPFGKERGVGWATLSCPNDLPAGRQRLSFRRFPKRAKLASTALSQQSAVVVLITYVFRMREHQIADVPLFCSSAIPSK